MARPPMPGRVEHGGAPAGWLDFSANTNPLGVPEAVAAAIAAARYERYSDLDPGAAERRLAAEAGVPASWVLLTAGATEALRLIAAAYLRPGVRAVIVGPTYGEYARLATLAGAQVEEIRAAGPCFRPTVRALARALREPRTVAIVCDPNNPTGQSIAPGDHRRLLSTLTGKDGRSALLVVDQSFAPFAATRAPDQELLATGRVVLVRSLTKLLAIPGVRIGYLLGRPRLLERLRAGRDPWPVGAHAVTVACATAWRLDPAARRQVLGWRRALVDGLRARGFSPCPSRTNFVLVDAGPAAAALVAGAARHRIAIRSCASFGLPEHIRLAVRPPAEQARLFAALDATLASSIERIGT